MILLVLKLLKLISSVAITLLSLERMQHPKYTFNPDSVFEYVSHLNGFIQTFHPTKNSIFFQKKV